jgi:hypothetical protein
VKKHELIAIAFAAASNTVWYEKGLMHLRHAPDWIALGTDYEPENLPAMAEYLFDWARRGMYPGEALYNTQVTHLGIKAPMFGTLPIEQQIPWLIFDAAVTKLLPLMESDKPLPAPPAEVKRSADYEGPFGNALAKQDHLMKREPWAQPRMKEVQDEERQDAVEAATAQQERTSAASSSAASGGEAHGADAKKMRRK